MRVFRKKVVEMTQNADGVFEPNEPDFSVGFDFNEPINTAGVSEYHFVNVNDLISSQLVGPTEEMPVRPEERPPLKRINWSVDDYFLDALSKKIVNI